MTLQTGRISTITYFIYEVKQYFNVKHTITTVYRILSVFT